MNFRKERLWWAQGKCTSVTDKLSRIMTGIFVKVRVVSEVIEHYSEYVHFCTGYVVYPITKTSVSVENSPV